jgi:hypothetical protein
MSRFGGSKPVIFKLIIGGSNMVRLAPNVISLFLT